MRTHNQLQVFVNDLERITEELKAPELAPYIELRAYAEINSASDFGLNVVFLEFPRYSLGTLVKKLRKQGVRSLHLLYKQSEQAVLMEQLPLLYPQREEMATAYKLVMDKLQRERELDVKQFLESHKTQLSENAVKIMQELGFVSLNNGIIKRNIIKRCQLEDSSLFVKLQAERRALENIYKENLRLSQYDLLRG